MVTEANWLAWEVADFVPYLDAAFDAFGSDWPVCKLIGEYRPVMEIVINYLNAFSSEEREKVLGGNCARFYRVG